MALCVTFSGERLGSLTESVRPQEFIQPPASSGHKRQKIGYAKPLLPPEPVRAEAGIPIPNYESFANKFASKEWAEITDTFAAKGALLGRTFQNLAGIISDAKIPTEGILRTGELTAHTLAWQVQHLGRCMQHRLAIEGARNGPTQDSLRASIQDTWLPGSTRLHRAARAIADVRGGTSSDAYDLWHAVRDNPVGRALAFGLESKLFGDFHLPLMGKERPAAVEHFNDQTVIWSVAGAQAKTGDVWSSRSLLHAIRNGFLDAGGSCHRSSKGYLIGGVPGADSYVEYGPETILYLAADRAWAQATGQPGGYWNRSRLPKDVETAYDMALGSLAPTLAKALTPAPTLERERDAWHQVSKPFTRVCSVDPAVLGWMREQGYAKKTIGEMRGDEQLIDVTLEGRERRAAVFGEM